MAIISGPTFETVEHWMHIWRSLAFKLNEGVFAIFRLIISNIRNTDRHIVAVHHMFIFSQHNDSPALTLPLLNKPRFSTFAWQWLSFAIKTVTVVSYLFDQVRACDVKFFGNNQSVTHLQQQQTFCAYLTRNSISFLRKPASTKIKSKLIEWK